MDWLIDYLCGVKPGKVILWCHLIWYLTMVLIYFDPTPSLWINSTGISIVIGTGLVLSVSSQKG